MTSKSQNVSEQHACMVQAARTAACAEGLGRNVLRGLTQSRPAHAIQEVIVSACQGGSSSMAVCNEAVKACRHPRRCKCVICMHSPSKQCRCFRRG